MIIQNVGMNCSGRSHGVLCDSISRKAEAAAQAQSRCHDEESAGSEVNYAGHR